MEKGPKIKISSSALFDGFLDNPRLLYNSNIAKVSIVKWSQKFIFVGGTLFFWVDPRF